MAGPHIFGSSFVTCFMIFMTSKQSLRFCSPSTLLKNSSTLASFTFVFISAIFDSLPELRQSIAHLFYLYNSLWARPPNGSCKPRVRHPRLRRVVSSRLQG